jgi:hypothetical protein
MLTRQKAKDNIPVFFVKVEKPSMTFQIKENK